MSAGAVRMWKGAAAGVGIAVLLQVLFLAALIGRALWMARSERATGIGFSAGGFREFAIVMLIFGLVGAAIGTLSGVFRR